MAKIILEAREVGLLQIDEEISGLLAFLLKQPRRNMLEIGSGEGGTFYLWCKLFTGRKISVDIPSRAAGSAGLAWARKRNLEFKRWAARVSTILEDSHSMSAYKKVARVLGRQKVDFLFIDGDHSSAGVQLDYFMYRGFVRPGGFIAFHDINDTPMHRRFNCRVAELWSELPGKRREINAHGRWGGIGLLKVE